MWAVRNWRLKPVGARPASRLVAVALRLELSCCIHWNEIGVFYYNNY